MALCCWSCLSGWQCLSSCPAFCFAWQKLHIQITLKLFNQILSYLPCLNQSLEFVAETRILAEMKIESRGKHFFSRKNKLTSILFEQSIGVAESMEIVP